MNIFCRKCQSDGVRHFKHKNICTPQNGKFRTGEKTAQLSNFDFDFIFAPPSEHHFQSYQGRNISFLRGGGYVIFLWMISSSSGIFFIFFSLFITYSPTHKAFKFTDLELFHPCRLAAAFLTASHDLQRVCNHIIA